MTGNATPFDLSSVLVAPVAPSQVDQAINRITSNAIPGLSQIDAVIGLFLEFSPLEEFVFKPFVGDWNALERAAVAWPQCGEAVALVNQRVIGIDDIVGDGWLGEAADEFARCQRTLGQLLADLPQQCEQAGVMDAELAAFARGIVEFIGEVLQGIISYGLALVGALATPPVGTVAIVGLVASAVATITGWMASIADLFNQFVGFQEAVAAIHSGIVGMYASVRQAATALSQAATIVSTLAGLVDSGAGIAGKVTKIAGAGNTALAGAGNTGGFTRGR
ncbi:hypothetical protein ACFSWE_15370 [Leucobacter albus]|uniref:Type VII secretion system (Wss) protein ESAT-6 n=1 Tax=Leucobacter albus TaxID=272210 RepID=A0ABW3TRM3_9MICO